MNSRSSGGRHSGADRSSHHEGAGRRVDAIARAPGGIGQALRRAEAYMALNARVREAIPENARGEIGIACVEGDCLVIAAASSARATQARLLAGALLQAAAALWPEKLARTRVIVTPGLKMD